MESSNYRILVVDDDELLRDLMVKFLSVMGCSYMTAMDGIDALEKLKTEKFDAIITDIKMAKMDGIELAMAVSMENPYLPVMITTGYGQEYSARLAFSVGALEFMHKPFSFDEFSIRLRKMIESSQMLKRMKNKDREENKITELKNELEEALTEDYR